MRHYEVQTNDNTPDDIIRVALWGVFSTSAFILGQDIIGMHEGGLALTAVSGHVVGDNGNKLVQCIIETDSRYAVKIYLLWSAALYTYLANIC